MELAAGNSPDRICDGGWRHRRIGRRCGGDRRPRRGGRNQRGGWRRRQRHGGGGGASGGGAGGSGGGGAAAASPAAVGWRRHGRARRPRWRGRQRGPAAGRTWRRGGTRWRGGGGAGRRRHRRRAGRRAAGAERSARRPIRCSTSSCPEVAVDTNGNAVVVYEHGGEIWSNYYSADHQHTGGRPTAIDARPGSAAQQASIAVDKNGSWLAVWAQDPNATLKGIYTQHVDQRHDLERDLAAHQHDRLVTPVLAMNAEGAAVVAWTEVESATTWQAAATTRATATGSAWGTATGHAAGRGQRQSRPVVAMSGTGEGFVLWTQDDDRRLHQRLDAPAHDQRLATRPRCSRRYDAQNSYSTGARRQQEPAPSIGNLPAGARPPRCSCGRAATRRAWVRRLRSRPRKAATSTRSCCPSVTLDDSGDRDRGLGASFRRSFRSTRTARPSRHRLADRHADGDGQRRGGDDPNSGIEHAGPAASCGTTPAGNVTLIWRKRAGDALRPVRTPLLRRRPGARRRCSRPATRTACSGRRWRWARTAPPSPSGTTRTSSTSGRTSSDRITPPLVARAARREQGR